MSSSIDILSNLLKTEELDAFLEEFESRLTCEGFDLKCISLLQVDFPNTLRRHFLSGVVTPKTIVSVWRLVTSGALLLVENDLRILINQNIDMAMSSVRADSALPVRPLEIFQDFRVPSAQPKAHKLPPKTESLQMNRVTIVSTFEMRTWSSSSAFDLRRNICSGPYEREFLRALRLYFPALLSYPNVTLQSFINLHELGTVIPDYFHAFATHASVDVLLCTPDEDPVAGFELESPEPANEQLATTRKLKNTLLQLAGIPLIQIRPQCPNTVRADDFFNLLNIKDAASLINPSRIRPKSTYEVLVPVSAEQVRSWRKADETS